MSRTSALGVGCLLAACTIGEPLVGERENTDSGGLPTVPCEVPPACSLEGGTGIAVRAVPQRAVHPADLSACGGGTLRPACSSDGGATWLDAEVEDEDAGVDVEFSRPQEFPQPANTDCDPPEGLAQFRALSGETLACAHRRFVFGADAAGEHLRLRGVTWTHSNLELKARVPLVVELDAPSISEVQLSLTGPLELRVNQAVRFNSVRLKAKRVGALPPHVSIERSDGRDLLLGSTETRLEGGVSIVRTALERSQFIADQVRFESSTFYDGRIETDALLSMDSELVEAVLVLGEAQLAAGKLMGVEVTECDALTFLSLTSRDGLYPSCRSAPHRFYESSVVGGLVDGDVQSERSYFEIVRFGSREPTRLVMWGGGTLFATALCGFTESAALEGSALNCNACQQAGEVVPVAICMLSDVDRSHENSLSRLDRSYENNFCGLFEAAEPCENPPERERPVMDKLWGTPTSPPLDAETQGPAETHGGQP